jgi:hypothetical protein
MAAILSGRRRGRPNKIRCDAAKPQGRPRLDFLSDPDRYAIAAVPVLREHLRLGQRDTAELAVAITRSQTAPETIRSKARKAWTREDGYPHKPGGLYVTLSKADDRKMWTRLRWLRRMANIVAAALFWEKSHRNQSLSFIEAAAARIGEVQAVRTIFIPLLDDRKAIEALIRAKSGR